MYNMFLLQHAIIDGILIISFKIWANNVFLFWEIINALTQILFIHSTENLKTSKYIHPTILRNLKYHFHGSLPKSIFFFLYHSTHFFSTTNPNYKSSYLKFIWYHKTIVAMFIVNFIFFFLYFVWINKHRTWKSFRVYSYIIFYKKKNPL